MTSMRTAVLFAPFWSSPSHIGTYRVDRFFRWLTARGVRVVIVRGGNADTVTTAPWGMDVVIRDPLGIYRDAAPAAGAPPTGRPENRLRRAVATTIISPDVGIAWARRAARHPAVLEAARGASWVISSSPPESAHVGAYLLARRVGAALVMDMRDGWLDEPLKPPLRRHRWRQWHEGRWERRIVRAASQVFVTSPVWKRMLEGRLADAVGKTVMLTNGYPATLPSLAVSGGAEGRAPDRPLRLLHAGRFSGSRQSQTVERLLDPLLRGLAAQTRAGEVRLLGTLEHPDVTAVQRFAPEFRRAGWALEPEPPVAREESLRRLQSADGLLLLSASSGSLPSKLFEYLAVGKPILAVTFAGSAVWQACGGLRQVTLLDYTAPEACGPAVATFLFACAHEPDGYEAPPQFGEPHLSSIFLRALGL